ncbi:MAG: ARMT1-like domain-containing protein [Candidatus Bathycorpusculaceae bacterium]
MDFGPQVDIDLEKEVEKVLNNELAVNDIDQLKKPAFKPRKILYLADNAGETVFDRISTEELLKRNVDVTYAVKDAPILNDATFRDAEIAGITEIAKVMSIGTDCTGMLLKDCSKKVS